MGKLIQQVNFYQPIFKREKKPFSASIVLFNVIIVILVMLSVSVYSWYQLQTIQQRVALLEANKKNLLAQFEKFKTSLKPRSANHLLSAKQDKLTLDLRGARKLYQLLAAEITDDQQSYSAYFRGLAEVSVNGLWLKQLTINQGGEFLSLSGQTLKPELVPKLLQSLQSKPVFNGHSFGKVQMNRGKNAEQGSAILFHLETLDLKTEVNRDAG